MNIQKIARLEFNSRFLQYILGNIYAERKFYKVFFGKLKGQKLYYQRDINYHAILGLWERDSIHTLTKLFRSYGLDQKEIVVADVGANIGYYSLFFSRYLHHDTKIFAFEPSVSIYDVLRKNINGNDIYNVKTLEMACADKTGEVEFYVGGHHHQSSVIAEWANNENVGRKMKVRSTTLDDFFCRDKNSTLPDLIKMDIEGGAVYALKGCEKCITEKRPFILIESHTPEEDGAISEVLMKHDYEAFRIDNKKWVEHKDRNYRDKQGVWGTMLLIPSEKKDKFVA